jgi:hypothetical protein
VGRLFLSFVLTVAGLTPFRVLEITLFLKVLLSGNGERKFLAAFLTDQEAVF